MKAKTENAILKNLLAETLRVYDREIGGAVSPSTGDARPGEDAARARFPHYEGLGPSDLRTKNAVLENLLSVTAEAYDKRSDAFRAEKQLVRQVFAATRDGVLTTDASGAVTSVNPAAEELIGWSLEEARGRPLAEVLRLVDSRGTPFDLDLAPCLQDGGELDLPAGLRAARRDGWRRPVDGHVAAIHDRLDGVIGAVVILRRDLVRS